MTNNETDTSQSSFAQLQEELEALRADYRELEQRLWVSRTELKTERLINRVAWSYIPEDLQDEFAMVCPHSQPDLTMPTPSPVVSFLFNRTHTCLCVATAGEKRKLEQFKPKGDHELCVIM
jgi:hypothetical protein